MRVENRVLPAGPTVVDTLANGAFYYGALRVLAEQERPVWSQMSFAAAEENFIEASVRGIDAKLFWPGVGEAPASELILRRLLPLAHQGLQEWGVDDAIRERLLGIIERRCLTGINGAAWQVQRTMAHEAAGSVPPRRGEHFWERSRREWRAVVPFIPPSSATGGLRAGAAAS